MKNLFLILLLLGFASCTEDNVDLKKEELLKQHPWRWTESIYVELGQPDQILDMNCASDDKWNLNKNGTYKWTLSNKCFEDKQPDPFGTWRIEGNNFYLTDMSPMNSIPIADREDDYQIEKLTESTLVLVDTMGTEGKLKWINTYKKF